MREQTPTSVLASAHDRQAPPAEGLFIVHDIGDGSPIETVARTLATSDNTIPSLGSTTHVALRDPYLRDQLRELHAHWEVRPAARGLWDRIRTRLAWTLLGPELRQTNRVHASLVRIVDSLVVHLHEERAARRRLEEQQTYRQDHS
jgi:hypothetical protein